VIALASSGLLYASAAVADGDAVSPYVPAPPVVMQPANGVQVADATPLVVGRAGADLDILVGFEGDTVPRCTASSDETGAWDCEFTTALADGEYELLAVAQSPLTGTISEPTRIVFTVDLTAPDAPVVTEPLDHSALTDTTPTFTGTAEAGVTVVVTVEGRSSACHAQVAASGDWTCPIPDDQALRPSDVVDVTAIDPAGNVSAETVIHFGWICGTPDSSPIVNEPVAGAVLDDTTPEFSGQSEPGTVVRIREAYGGPLVCQDTADTDATWSCVPETALAEGDHTFHATAIDQAGNESDPYSFTVTIEPPTRTDFAAVLNSMFDRLRTLLSNLVGSLAR
jgi:hypothetical protein